MGCKVRYKYLNYQPLLSFISTMWDVKEEVWKNIDTVIMGFISTMWDVKQATVFDGRSYGQVLSRLCGM